MIETILERKYVTDRIIIVAHLSSVQSLKLSPNIAFRSFRLVLGLNRIIRKKIILSNSRHSPGCQFLVSKNHMGSTDIYPKVVPVSNM